MCERGGVLDAGPVGEGGTGEENFKPPTPPYTKGLIRALPKLHEHEQKLYSIPGTVPRARVGVTGCRFSPRCEFAFDRCFKENPGLYTMEADHRSRCFLYDDEKEVNRGEESTLRS